MDVMLVTGIFGDIIQGKINAIDIINLAEIKYIYVRNIMITNISLPMFVRASINCFII